MSLLAIEALSVAIHGAQVLRGVAMAAEAGEVLGRDRRERLGQVDDRAGGDAGCCRPARVATGRVLLDGSDLLALPGGGDVRGCAAATSA